MAKQRLQPKLKSPLGKPLAGGSSSRPLPPEAEPRISASSAGSPRQDPQRRTSYLEAVAVYEKGVAALQRHDYDHALELLQSVLKQYPEEKELHERVRLYLNVCERHVAAKKTDPQTIEERLYASTLAINGGKYDEAISHLRLVRDEDPDNDHALYMLAVAHAQRGEHAQAVAHLERSIALNPENRALARRDPDLDPLHDDDAFRSAVEPRRLAQAAEPDRRTLRPKTAR
jgi:outer membrane protein assembly factor BamD (BamD/ComL family)